MTSGRVNILIPKSIEEPHSITFYYKAILVSMPTKVDMSSVLYIKHPMAKDCLPAAKGGIMAYSSISKAMNNPSYAEVVRHKASNMGGMSPACLSHLVGSQKQSSDFSELTGGGIFNQVQCHSIPRNVAKPRIFVSNSSDSYLGMKKHGESKDAKSMLPAVNCGDLAQNDDEPRRIASSDRLSDPLDIDNTDLRKGLEERVGLAN
ncbi:hypothetical protein Ancab_039371 [Ancistrocladus abbreviatus]